MIGYRRICSTLVAPILKELPFFLITFFLFGSGFISEIIGQCQNYVPMLARGLAGRIGLLFLYDYLLVLFIYYSKSKIVKYALYVIVLFLYGVISFLLLNFEIGINANVLILLLETNGREASEFVNNYMFSEGSMITYRKVVIRLFAIVALEYVYRRYVNKSDTSNRKLELWLFLPVVLFLVWGIISFGTIIRICSHDTTEHFFHQHQLEDVRPTDPFSCLILGVYGVRIVGHEMNNAIETTKNLKAIPMVDRSDSLDVVLVIGESANKWHFSIYGYGHETTPRLEQEKQKGNLFVFNDIVSPFSLTSPTVKSMLSCNSISDGENWSKHPIALAIFKAAQYNVYFWDNQKDQEPGASFSVSLNSFLYDKQVSSLSYTAINDKAYKYDDDLVRDFEMSDKQLSDHNLVIFHLKGQHFVAGERFPHVREFSRFTVDSVHRPETYMQDTLKRHRVADYDNAVLYNDSVLQHVFDIYKERNAVVIYLSDHGEETYDYKDAIFRYYEGHMTKGWLKHIHNIPFVIWCSDKYIQKHGETVRSIGNATNRPFMIDNLCQLLFHLGEIRSDYYIPERDLISNQFKPRRRLIEDMFFKKYDYDEVKNGQ